MKNANKHFYVELFTHPGINYAFNTRLGSPVSGRTYETEAEAKEVEARFRAVLPKCDAKDIITRKSSRGGFTVEIAEPDKIVNLVTKACLDIMNDVFPIVDENGN